MELGERKRKILQAIIDTYVETAEPVGSRLLSKHSNLGLSPATIRNEMADLEEMGLLEQPHTSAGRIPSHSGYRFYVDSLMQRYRLSVKEIEEINQAMRHRFAELDRIIAHAGRMMSELTNYTTIASTPSLNQAFIKKVEVIRVDDAAILIVLLISGDIIKNRLFRFNKPVDDAELAAISTLLNDSLAGRTISSITPFSLAAIERLELGTDVAESILIFATDTLKELSSEEYYISGAKRILGQPEYQDMKKASDFIDTLENRETVKAIISTSDKGAGDIQITIGGESALLKTHDASVILCRYNSGDDTGGIIGIIGPVRMDYARIVSSLEYFTKQFNRSLSHGEQDKQQQ